METRSERVAALIDGIGVLARKDPHAALARMEEAARLARTEGSVDQQAHSLRMLASLQHETGDVARACETLKEIPQSQNPDTRASVELTQGWLAYLRTDLHEALIRTQACLRISEAASVSPGVPLWAANNLGVIYRALGAPELALAQYLKARKLARAQKNAQLEGGVLANLCELHLEGQDYTAALEVALQGVPLAESSGDLYLILTAYGNVIQAQLGLENREAAGEAAARMATFPRPIPLCEVIFWGNQGRLLHAQGDTDAAVKAFQRALRAARRGKLVEVEVRTRYELARVLVDSAPASALRLARATLRQTQAAGVQSYDAPLHELIADLAEARGRTKLALTHLREWQNLQKKSRQRDAEQQRVLFSVELGLEAARTEAAQERRRSARLEEEAARDGMTGLYNHATFQKNLRERLDAQETVTLLLIDVDDFKSYNDRFGHVAGDVLLKDLAQLLLAATRDEDLLARYGGEEFALIVRGETSLGLEIGERLRALVALHAFDRASVTISVGIASSPPCPPIPRALVEAADQALYRAKHLGKNKTQPYESDKTNVPAWM
jgi:diguanylate cyclase (GGDEF)-like protein